ncbi:hypothetical protein P3T76_007103 [Phytophthora citrophthora]|uniref:CLASP N-terminal domain-containing protein n=1 Tax=Phytophthora citrophthora TaxID=4793 RepID=A0AAD9GMD7_9STRA|nr:hypothetical protein P3T76_007103 [Phytophthora citrophthora]
MFINMHLGSIRSKLVKDVCEHLLRIVKVTGLEFQDMANALLPHIINTAKNSSGAVRQPGSRLMGTISELVRYDLSLMRKIYVQLVQDKARVLMLEQLGIIFVFWDDNEVQMWDADVLEIMRQGLEDQNDKVRKTAREVLTRFSSRWSERVDELMEMPSNQSKALLISEHRTSILAQAILKKFPDLASKSDSFSRSRSSFTSSRSSSFRKSPRHKREQDIEIHVSSTPPRKQREGRSSSTQKTADTAVATGATTRQSVAAPESTERRMSAVSRRLFKDPDFSSGNDTDQQDDVALGSFDGSQMHGFQSKVSKVSKSETNQLLAPEISDVPRPPRAIPSRAITGRSSSAPNAEEASLRHPGVRKLQESKIPSPLTRSPSLLSKKRPGSPARSTSSPEILPSRLTRPGSFTLKSRGSSGASTPKGSATFDNKTETNPLSASDEYFSKPIPSSVAAPTPPPPSTDNVTLRPRRRGLVHQEPEDSLDPHILELPVPQTLSRSRPAETTPESNVYNVRLDEETEPPIAGQSFDNTGGHATESNGHVESAYDHRRLNDYDSRSNSSLEGTHQINASIGGGDDMFPDDWRLDDGPRHKFDFEDEIGDHLSDENLDQTEFVGREAHRTSMNKADDIETEWHENVGSSQEEHFTQHQNYDEATGYERQVEELNLENAPNDALTGLLNVRDEMSRLRAITKSEGKSNGGHFRQQSDLSARYTFDTAHEELQDPAPISRFEGSPDQPRDGTSFLQRLTDADRLARSPLVPPPGESVHGKEGFIPPETYEKGLQPVVTNDPGDMNYSKESNGEREQADDNALLGQRVPSTSALPVFEQGSTTIDESQPESCDFVEGPVEHYSPHVESSASPQQISHRQEPYTAHHDQAGRFDAAEKLFAAKEISRIHDYNDDPQSPKREPMRPHLLGQGHFRHLEPPRERYPPPTSMGAKLATAFPNAQRRASAELNTYDASNEGNSENVTEAGNAEDEGAPQSRLDQSRPQTCQPIARVAETTPQFPQTENDHAAANSKPTLERSPSPARLSWFASFAMSIVVFLAAIFCIAGILHAAKKVNESHEYHQDLKARIYKFESSIAESHRKVLKLEEDYADWSEQVRKLMEEEEANALAQLQTIQIEVQKWQQGMKEDLVQFRQALSVDSIEAAFAKVLGNSTKEPTE